MFELLFLCFKLIDFNWQFFFVFVCSFKLIECERFSFVRWSVRFWGLEHIDLKSFSHVRFSGFKLTDFEGVYFEIFLGFKLTDLERFSVGRFWAVKFIGFFLCKILGVQIRRFRFWRVSFGKIFEFYLNSSWGSSFVTSLSFNLIDFMFYCGKVLRFKVHWVWGFLVCNIFGSVAHRF